MFNHKSQLYTNGDIAATWEGVLTANITLTYFYKAEQFHFTQQHLSAEI